MSSLKSTSLRKQWPLILRFIKPYWPICLFILFFLIGDALFDISVAWAQGTFIDSISSSDQKAITRMAAVLTAALLGFIILLAIHRYLLTWLNHAVYKDMSLHLFGLINRLPYSFIRKQLPGDLVLRVKEDTKHGSALIEGATEFITVLIIISLSFGYLLKVDALLAVLALLSVIIIFFSSRFFDRRLRSESGIVEAEEAMAQNNIQQYLGGINVIKQYEAQHWFLGKLRTQHSLLHRSRLRLAQTESMADQTALSLFSLTQLLALSILALSAARNSLTPGMVVSCSLLFELVVWPILGLSRQWSGMQKSAGAFQRIYDWMRLDTPIASKEEERGNAGDAGSILRLENVLYQPEDSLAPVLHGITLQILPGETVAIVGPSGAGKSTLGRLCAGLYEPTAGETLIGGRPAPDHLALGNSEVTYVTQHPAFFDGTVRDNMLLNRVDTSEQEMIQAAESADLLAWIEQLDGKFDAPVQERGLNLSGGQRQRLSLSRVFLRQSDLYIFDEPTSALDSQSEQRVVSNLLSYLEDKTVLIITHKMDIAKRADRILVLDQGTVVEAGTHEQLMHQQGLYCKLYQLGE